MSKHARMCLNKQGSEYVSGPTYAKTLNIAKFLIWQGSKYASVTQRSGYAWKHFDRVQNISWVLNMPEFWIWQGSVYIRVIQASKYTTMWLKISE